MQSVKDFSPAEFRIAYPDTCFTCHLIRVTAGRQNGNTPNYLK